MTEELGTVENTARDVDYGAIVGVPNEFERLEGVLAAAQEFQAAIAQDNNDALTAALESWLSGQSADEVAASAQDEDLLGRAQAELGAAIDMLQQLLADGEMDSTTQSTLRSLLTQLQAVDRNSPSQVLQAAADIRSGQGAYGVMAAQTRDYIEKLRQAVAEDLHDIDEEQRRNMDRLRQSAGLSDQTRELIDEHQAALDAGDDHPVGSPEWYEAQERIRIAQDRVSESINQDRRNNGGSLPEETERHVEAYDRNQSERDDRIAAYDREIESEARRSASYNPSIQPNAMAEGEQPEVQSSALAALAAIGMDQSAGNGRG